jgi:Avidin family
MTIENVDGATFSGTYASSVSDGQGPVHGTLAGTVSGDAVAFAVNWAPTYSSVTGWNGLLLSDGSGVFIYSLWNLASTPEQPENFWESILAGADLFEQMTTAR